jgi:hypothetical protein
LVLRRLCDDGFSHTGVNALKFSSVACSFICAIGELFVILRPGQHTSEKIHFSRAISCMKICY